jgi:DUF917 family protein/N-methylhydantoinase A/oxoprolinase/acetone carboxylase beta subunit
MNEKTNKSCRPSLTIGVDVGGTNTDTVLLNTHEDILCHAKTRTTPDVNDGIIKGVQEVLLKSQCNLQDIAYINLSTTHMLNALLQANVSPVAIIRLGAPSTTSLPPQCDWTNKPLTEHINGYTKILAGGCHYDGSIATPLNREELKKAARDIKKLGIKHVAITGVFSQLAPSQEQAAADILLSIAPDLEITLSVTNNGGLLERENMTIVIAALQEIFKKTFNNVRQALYDIGLVDTQFLISHNDGTLSPLATANPYLSLQSGPTNSLRGAGKLCSNYNYAIAADIGGTSTDAGIIKNNEPIEKDALFRLAGINFKSPTSHVETISLGGDTRVIFDDDGVRFGKSITNQHEEQSMCFGGDTFTITDVAVAKQRISPLNCQTRRIQNIPAFVIEEADQLLHTVLANLLTDVWASVTVKPHVIILVGGAACLFDCNKLHTILSHTMSDIKIIIPEYSSIANAIGAATAHISGTYNGVYDLHKINRTRAYKNATDLAIQQAIKNGASPKNIHIKSIYSHDISYIPGATTRIQVKVASKPALQSVSANKVKDLSLTNAENTLKENKTFFSTQQQYIERINNSCQQLTDNPKVALEISKKLSTIKPLQTHDIDARAIGYDFLGSGGGGSTRLMKLMVMSCLKKFKALKELPIDDLPDDAEVISCGFIGSPAIFEEDPPSIDSLVNSILKMEQISNKKINAIIAYEGGGANGLVPYVVAAELDIPVIDADTMGRAFPGINMVTPAIYDGMPHCTATLTTTRDIRVIHASCPDDLEEKCRLAAQELGAMAFLSFYPFTGKLLKQFCVKNTTQIAEAIGKHFILSKSDGSDPIKKINKFLRNTDYGEVKEQFNGRITNIHKSESLGFSMGVIQITADDGTYDVIFQNENILARKHQINGDYQEIACVPNLITIVDAETFEPIGTPEYTYGRKVRVLTIDAPPILKTEQALKVVGPSSPTYQIDKILAAFDNG